MYMPRRESPNPLPTLCERKNRMRKTGANQAAMATPNDPLDSISKTVPKANQSKEKRFDAGRLVLFTFVIIKLLISID
jgi:hypothetical protein